MIDRECGTKKRGLDFDFRVSGVRCRVSGAEYRVQGIDIQGMRFTV